MKTFTLFLTVLSFNVYAGEGLTDVFNQYADLQSALANDHFDHAKMSSAKLNELVGKVDSASLDEATQKVWSENHDPLAAALASASKADSINDLRVQFDIISKAVISLGLTSESSELNQFHCPMAFGGKGADWLQKGDSTMNPYFGAAMLKCGKMVKAASHKHEMQH